MAVRIPDERSAAVLAGLTEAEYVRGPDGRILGRFTPTPPGMSFPELGVTDEELKRPLTDPNALWRTADEVMARLRGPAHVPSEVGEPVVEWLAETHAGMTPGEQHRLADGVEAFNAQLRENPEDVGESRSDGFRIAFPPLLAVGFQVDPARRAVWVTRAKRYGR